MANKALHGSERQPLPGARSIGKADPAERFEVSVIVRRRAGNTFDESLAAVAKGDTSKRLRHEDFAAKFGADPSDIATVKKFAAAHGLTVTQEDAARRTVVLSGTVAQFSQAFGVDLEMFEHPNGTYRGRTGAIFLPAELHGVVEAVLGLDNRPQAKPHFRIRRPPGNAASHAAAAAATSYTPIELAALYGFPQGNGAGQCIGIIELGGGYRPADLQTYFSGLGIPPPKTSAVSVDHGKNQPTGDPNGSDGEVMLDIEVCGAIAPAANIAVYFAPNTDAGFLDAITTAIHDTANKPSVISISWGDAESSWTQQAMTAFDEAFQSAATLGITVCVATGDNGSGDSVGDGKNHADFPASSPHALACGGTSLHSAGGKITSEVVWNDGAQGGATGGGVSSFFPLPTWQTGLETATGTVQTPLAARGIPDVCGDADPETGYDVRIDGTNTQIGGTSAVAPLWSGLIARVNAANASTGGYLNPGFYAKPTAFNDITQGNNGGYTAAPGWDACTGLGSPSAKTAGAFAGAAVGKVGAAAGR
jgi:kumamolisin